VKRRYKPGHWIRVPLGGEYDAVGILARACRSRLFGYFFSVPANREITHDEMRALKAEDALCALLFGDSALEQARWEIIATSLPFDPQAWPFPDFAARGAFGESFTRVRYDPAVMQIIVREAIDAQTAGTLSDARFADAHEVESMLRSRIAGVPGAPSYSVCEMRSPVDAHQLQAVERGGRVQFSTPLSPDDLDRLAQFLARHPHVELRVHGFRHGFDAAALAQFRDLRVLTLDVHHLQHPMLLQQLQSLQALRLGAMQTDLRFLRELSGLRELELRGTRGALEPVHEMRSLRTLSVENTAPIALPALACRDTLEVLALAHGTYDLHGIEMLKHLRSLHLRSLDIEALPPLDSLAHLAQLEVHALPLRDLAPIAALPSLRTLRVLAMPHLNVNDFAPLQRCAGLQLFVDLGSKRKAREVYRLHKSASG
jgi:hypothetical protein